MVGAVGLEPTRFSTEDFESSPATYYGKRPFCL